MNVQLFEQTAMAAIAMMVGGAAVNVLAFTVSSYKFSKLNFAHTDAERICHDKAIEELQTPQTEWSGKRTECLD